ncbi:MAG: glycosyltransferase family 39 protein, partial [candidate division WOR-3 bacterium]
MRLNKSIFLILAIALFLRLFHFYQLKINNPIFNIPIVDSAEYVKVAEYILDKNFFGLPNSYYHPPLYYYFVAFILKIFNHSIDAIRILQILLDLMSLLIVYFLAKRLFTNSIGLISAFLYAVYIPVIQANSEILPSILIIFLLILSVLGLIKIYENIKKQQEKIAWLLISAISYGFLIITFTNFLIILPFILLWLYALLRKTRPILKIKYIIIFLFITILPSFLVTLRNYLHSGELVLISYNGGINFYIGNNPDINKTVSIQPGYQWDSLMTTAYISEKISNFSEMQNYWYKKALQFIINNPLKWANITIKKAILFFNAWEFPRNTDEEFFNNYSIISKFPFLKSNLLFPISFAGLIFVIFSLKNAKQKEVIVLIILISLGYAFTIILIFITSRYRLPIIPFFCLFAGYLIIKLIESLKQKKLKSVFKIIIFFIMLVLFTQIKFFKNEYPYEKPKSLGYIQISRALLENNKITEANKYLIAGLQLPPDELTYELYYIGGLYYNKLNKFEEATEYFKKAVDLNLYFHYAYNQLGYLYKKTKQIDSAIYYLKMAVEIPHADAIVYFNLADCHLIKNELENAMAVFESYIENKPSPNPIIYEGLARLYIKKQNYINAIENLKMAIKYPQGYEITPEIFNLIGICYMKLGDLENAKKYWIMGLRKNRK